MLLDELLLQATEEGLGYSIVPTVSPPAHARLKMICLAETPPCITAILSALRKDVRLHFRFRNCSLTPLFQWPLPSGMPKQPLVLVICRREGENRRLAHVL
jgi:hypothetical protein